MKQITIPVDDVVYERLAARAKAAGEPDLALYARDVLRANARPREAPIELPQPIAVNLCPLDLALPGVYVVRHRVHRRWYVGSARSIARRLAQHASLLRTGKHHNERLQSDWNQDGESAFEWGVIDLLPGATRDDLLTREHRWIAYLRDTKGHEAVYNRRTETEYMPDGL